MRGLSKKSLLVWFLYDNGLRHERVKECAAFTNIYIKFIDLKFLLTVNGLLGDDI